MRSKTGLEAFKEFGEAVENLKLAIIKAFKEDVEKFLSRWRMWF